MMLRNQEQQKLVKFENNSPDFCVSKQERAVGGTHIDFCSL